jgi:hypothetical protein
MEKRCETRDRLFNEYREALQEWVASINKLEEEDRVEETRFRAMVARHQYENHIADHGCGLS